MTAASQQIGAWLNAFTRQPRDYPAWLKPLREEAFARFSERGFPSVHDEDWRFTSVAPVARRTWNTLEGWLIQPAATSLAELPEEARRYLAQHAPQDNPFVALNTAFFSEVSFVHVPRNTVAEQPIEITYGADGSGAYHPRVLIVVGAGAQCTIVETYKGKGSYFTNAVTEIVAGEGAIVDHYKVQLEDETAFHVATLQAALGRTTNFSTHNISLGGALVRNDIGATLSEGTEATVNGLYVVNGTQHIDNHTVIDHAKPHGVSHELYKGILDDKATAVFNGRIMVRKDAQKTDSKQTNKNLVLSDEAVINTKPELQIFADDVRCTHGATIGQLDAESLFYMRSRGIGKEQARSLLTYAFAQDIIDRIKVQGLKDSLERVLFEKFHEHSQQ
jgi:Fe-S cluster assembly protein SufD